MKTHAISDTEFIIAAVVLYALALLAQLSGL